MIDTGLTDRVVLVTGANHGIGAATARAFAAQGAAVFLHYLRIPLEAPIEAGALSLPGEALYRAGRARPADDVLRQIHERGGRAASWEGDLSNPATIPALFDRVEEAFGPVEVLVNNAAHWEGGDTFLPLEAGHGHTLARITPAIHDRYFAVNSRGTALMMAEFLRRHVERTARRGRIINVSTDAARCFPGEISYAASKAALESLSRSAAWEMARFGITVNVVAPGPIQTNWISPEVEAQELPHIPLGRIGQPDDVADVIVFLASEQARWLTGQLLYAGGGKVM